MTDASAHKQYLFLFGSANPGTAGEVAISKPALDAQQPYGRLLHGLVDAPDLSL